MTEGEVCEELTRRLTTLEDPPGMYGSVGVSAQADLVAAASIQAGILARFLEMIQANAAYLPSKEVVLAALEKAIDALLLASGRPILVGLLGPALKRKILDEASRLYDMLLGVA